MIPVSLPDLALEDVADPTDPTARFRYSFPMHGGTGNADSAVVYMELEPGTHLGMHTDSQEEVLLVLEGTAEARIGEDAVTLRAGGMATIPAMAPHDLRNIGDGRLRVVGFFSGAVVYSTFLAATGTDAPDVVTIHGAGEGAGVYAMVPVEE